MRTFDPEVAETVSRVAGVHPFTGQQLAVVGALIALPDGWTVLFEDRGSSQALLVLSGDVEIRHDETTVAHLAPGAMIGESLIAARRPTRATLVARGSVQLLRLGARDVGRVVDADPDFAARLESIVVTRLGAANGAGSSVAAGGIDAGYGPA